MSDQAEVKKEITYAFKPQPGPQTRFLRCPVEDVLFGGARGGGKSYAVLGHFPAKAAHNFAAHGKPNSFNGLILRKTFPEFKQLLEEAKKLYAGIARWEAGEKRFVFPEDSVYGGAILYFGYLYLPEHSARYQGLNLQWLCAEEAQSWATPSLLDKLKATLRTAAGGKTYFIITANPGGVGHAWIKERYVDPAPPNTVFEFEEEFEGEIFKTQRVYIPSLLTDNVLLMQNDPTYRARILAAAAGNEGLKRGWILGDWNIQSGTFWDSFSPEKHILRAFKIPESWQTYRAFDWGSSAPFAIIFASISDGTTAIMADGSRRTFPKGTTFIISEIYGARRGTDEGLRQLERDTIKMVQERERMLPMKVRDGPADVNIFNEQDGKALNTEWVEAGFRWIRADKSGGSRVVGWQRMRSMMQAALEEPAENPGLFFFDNCTETLRTLPLAQISEKNPEDLELIADHLLDSIRYMLLFQIPAPVRFGRIQGF